MPDGILHLVFLAQTGVLVITSLLIIYPLVSHARNVAYTEGLVLLSVTLLLLTLLSVLDVIYGAELVANVLRLVTAVTGFVGIWFFARDFIDVGGGNGGGLDEFGMLGTGDSRDGGGNDADG